MNGASTLSDSDSTSSTNSFSDDEFGIGEELNSVLDRWEKLTASGTPTSPEELCGGDEKLAAQLQEHIACLKGFERFDRHSAPEPPERIGPYRILAEIAHGNCSIVYLAEQEFPPRKVALKLLYDVTASPRRLKRFRLEAELLGTLQHANIAHIFDAGVADVFGASRLYFTMEWIEGKNVLEYVRAQQKDAAWTSADTIKLCLDFADALSEAHSEGIVHRDLKPANLLVSNQGIPKLIDFGLATVRKDDTSFSRLSTADGILGTRCYMSPEQFSGNPASVDVRTDVYGFGVVLYELLAGQLPYDVKERSLWETMEIVKHTPPRPIGNIDRRLGRDLEVILETALAKESSERYQSIDAFADDLRCYLAGRPIAARRIHAGTVIWKWCQRHRRAAVFSALACTALVALALSTIVFARHAYERAENLDMANHLLESNRSRLEESNLRLAETGNKLRRTAFNQALQRLGAMADRDANYVFQQLHNESVCPSDLRGFAWHILEQRVKNPISQWIADESGLLDLAISDDGTWLATSSISSVRVWDLQTRKLIADTHQQAASPAVRLSIDNEKEAVLFCRRDGKPVRFDLATHAVTALKKTSSARTTALASIPGDGGYLVADEKGSVECWTETPESMRWTQAISQNAIIGLTVAANGKQFGAMSASGELIVCDLANGERIDHQQVITSVKGLDTWFRGRFSSDLKRAFLCAETFKTTIWDLHERKSVRVFEEQKSNPDVGPVEYSSDVDAPVFLVAGRGRVSQWEGDVETATLYHRDYLAEQNLASKSPLEIQFDRDPVAVDASNDGARIAIALRNGELLLVTASPRPFFESWVTPRPTLSKLGFSDSGEQLMAHSGGGDLWLYATNTGKLQWHNSTPGENNRIHDAHFLDEDRHILVRQLRRGLSLRRTDSGESMASVHVTEATKQMIPIGNRVLLGLIGNQAAWLPIEQLSEGIRLGQPPQDVDTSMDIAVIDRSSGLIATLREPGIVAIGSVDSDNVFHVVGERQLNEVQELALLPGGQVLATGFRDGSIGVWNTSTMTEITRVEANATPVGGLDFAADGSVMASGHFDGEVLFWDTTTWEPQLSVRTQLDPIRDVRFCPSGNTLAVGGKGGFIAIFRTESGGNARSTR